MSIVSGNCCLMIRGHDSLDFDSISHKLLINPTTFISKGEIRYKSSGEVKSDIWIYEVKKKNDEEPNQMLLNLINDLKTNISSIKILSATYDMCIRCYIQSDLAQIGFELSPQVIIGLSELSLRLEFSILSWGEVEMEGEIANDN